MRYSISEKTCSIGNGMPKKTYGHVTVSIIGIVKWTILTGMSILCPFTLLKKNSNIITPKRDSQQL